MARDARASRGKKVGALAKSIMPRHSKCLDFLLPLLMQDFVLRGHIPKTTGTTDVQLGAICDYVIPVRQTSQCGLCLKKTDGASESASKVWLSISSPASHQDADE